MIRCARRRAHFRTADTRYEWPTQTIWQWNVTDDLKTAGERAMCGCRERSYLLNATEQCTTDVLTVVETSNDYASVEDRLDHAAQQGTSSMKTNGCRTTE